MRCDVNLKMTYFLRGKQFCITFKSTFCYFVIPCNLIWILLLPSVTHLCYTYLCHNIDIFIDAIEIYSFVLFLKDTLFIITLKSYLTEYIDIALSDLVLFIFSQILPEYVTIETEGVCMYVRACVCLCQRYSLNGSTDFNEILHR